MVAKKLAVLGSPISHSKSPQIHDAAYSELGLNWSYERLEVGVQELNWALLERVDISAFSLTMPLKTAAYEFALAHGYAIDETASTLCSVNTMVRTDGGFAAFNTDVYGVTESFRTAEVPTPASVAILGSGATSRSVLMGVCQYFKNVERVTIFARNADAAAITIALLNDFSTNPIEAQWLPLEAAADFGGADLTCNTLPVEVAQGIEVDVPLSDGWLFDVAYSPWPSKLALVWPESNRISGLEMLLNQALEQVRIFVNGDATAELPSEGHVLAAMRAACQ